MKKSTLAFILSIALLSACNPDSFSPFPNLGGEVPERGVEELEYEKLLILYLEGYNNLTFDIQKNISEFSQGYLPKKSDKQAVLVYSHNAVSKVDWHTKTEPVIYRMYTHYGEVIRDTLFRFPADEVALRPEVLRKSLNFIRKNFPSASYGMLFSSHASGWIPKAYTLKSEDMSPFSVGAEYDNSTSINKEYNLDITEFAEAIPMHLDYIVFDCCLMGGVETNYVLRNCTDKIVASPTEVLSEGFDYLGLGERLLREGEADLIGVCEDYYSKCADSYATVALYDCSYMDELADKCKSIFGNHPNQVLEVKSSEVQSYNFSFDYHYDFRDIIAKMGASQEELADLDETMEKLVIYKKSTPRFINVTIEAERYSGMSMYLPRKGWNELNDYYMDTDWNKATGLLR